MKKLYIIRHAKAEEPAFSKRDYSRNLTDKGKEKALYKANHLAETISINETTWVISSSANRAIQTAQIFCHTLQYPLEQVRQEITIYEAHYLDILQVINQVPDNIDTLFVFGHNPGLSILIHYLTGNYINLKTSDTAYLELEEGLNFAQLSAETAYLKKLID